MSSSDLAAKIIDAEGGTEEAARKRVSRLAAPACVLFGLKLPKNARFVYHQQDFNSERYFQRLTSVLKETGSAYGRALHGLNAQGGVVPQSQFSTVSGLPIRDTKKHLRHDVVESKLQSLSLIATFESPDGNLVGLAGEKQISKRRRAERSVEDIFLGIIRTHLGRINLTSYKAGKTRVDGVPAVGPFNWDFSAPTYAAGLVGDQKKPGFVVGDIRLGSELSIEDITPFLSKCDALIGQKRAARILPFFAADYFAKAALDELRKRGFMILSPETLYGKDFAELLRQLTFKIENAAAALANNPKELFTLLSELMRIEGAALNLRGVVLEFMVAQIFATDGYQFDIRQKVQNSAGEVAEIDVKAMKRQECVCVECKAPIPGNLVSKQEVEDWLERSLPRIKDWLKQRDPIPEKIRFEFCTSTDFHEDALPLIERIKRQHVRQPISFLNGEALLERLKRQKQNAFVNIFLEQFGRVFVNRPSSHGSSKSRAPMPESVSAASGEVRKNGENFLE